MPNIIRLMSPTRAIGILDGHIPWDEPVEYLEAALYVSLHEHTCRPQMAASLYRVALQVADFAVDHGEEVACKMIREAKAGITEKTEAAAFQNIKPRPLK